MKPPRHIYVIGAGGVTTYFLPALIKTVRFAIKAKPTILIVDGDRLEERNLERQLFDPRAVGENKAEALAAQYRLEYPKVRAVAQFFHGGWQVQRGSLLFVFVDNHVARRAALSVCDRHEGYAIIAANEYTDSQAIWYSHELRDTPKDPRVVYPEILTDQAGDPTRPVGCLTDEALVAAPQLAFANLACAAYAGWLFWFYYFVAPELNEAETRQYWPIEHSNNFNAIRTRMEGNYASAA